MVTTTDLGAGLFAHYPAKSGAVRGSAEDLITASERIEDVGAEVTARQRVAIDAVAGTVEAPMSSAAAPVAREIGAVSAAAAVAGGALNLFARAIDTYNAGIDELNRRYDEARAADFFAQPVAADSGEPPSAAQRQQQYDARVAEARTAIEYTLGLVEDRLRERLDHAASSAAVLLHHGPSTQSMRFLTSTGALPGVLSVSDDDGETLWAPGDLTYRCDPSSPEGCDLFSDDGWGLNWDQFVPGMQDLWTYVGHPTWDFLIGDAINACTDDPISGECGLEGAMMIPILKLGKVGRGLKAWLDKLRDGLRRSPSPKPTVKIPLKIGRDDLSVEQMTNLKRYEKRLPASAEETQIRRLPGGSAEYSAKVPGRVPGSYAVYTKTVDSTGETISYTKTTYAPDGEIVHRKDKFHRDNG
jgi:hypothetical protein